MLELSDDKDIADMGESDPGTIRQLQEHRNEFPKRNFDEKSTDPLEQLKNQVRVVL